MEKTKKNVWETLEARLREAFPYPWPETDWHGEPLQEDDKVDYYESRNDPLISFLIGEGEMNSNGVEFVEFEPSFYASVSYDEIPQGTEDDCEAVIYVDGKFYKVGVFFTSWSGYRLNEIAYEVSPKTVEVVVYE